jgi:AraC family transcriptional regulator
VIDRISDHLADPPDLPTRARLGLFSASHFHRIFRSLVGGSLHIFVRRLRLEKAVSRVQYGSKAALTQIALDCGFG